ncbi:WhiB family transcriptional regulator [Streptomyces sp. NPDC058417]|uniref:WhiB family transcriptional regulator n=1 Tax=unclassified Streptomyces TaxID=2593676 RepID=UPI00364AC861
MTGSTLRTNWAQRAACVGVDPEIFFPSASGTGDALHICGGCPVRAACLEDVLRAEGQASAADRHGIVAGLDPQQRRQMSEQRGTVRQQDPTPAPAPKAKRQPAKCGTRSGYQRHLKDKTAICGPCRQANTDADNRLRRTGTTRAAA